MENCLDFIKKIFIFKQIQDFLEGFRKMGKRLTIYYLENKPPQFH